MNRQERRAAKARWRRGDIHEGPVIEVLEGRTNVSEVPICVDRLLDDGRQLMEAKWAEGGPTMSFTLIAADRVYVAIPPDHEDEDKPLIRQGLAELIQHVGANRYVFMAEAWAGTSEFCRPRDDPKRLEMLLIGAATIEGGKAIGWFEIKRDAEGRASLANWEILECGRGWMLELFDNVRPPTLQ